MTTLIGFWLTFILPPFLLVLLVVLSIAAINRAFGMPYPREHYSTPESHAAALAAAKQPRIVFWWLKT